MTQVSPQTTRKPLMWLAMGTLAGVGLCVFCALSYFIFQEINAGVRESALDEQCFFDDTTRTDAECDAWVEQVTTEHRPEFIECSGRGTSEAVYVCLVEKGLGP